MYIALLFVVLVVFLICSILIRTIWEFIVSFVTKCGKISGAFTFCEARKLGFYREFAAYPAC